MRPRHGRVETGGVSSKTAIRVSSICFGPIQASGGTYGGRLRTILQREKEGKVREKSDDRLGRSHFPSKVVGWEQRKGGAKDEQWGFTGEKAPDLRPLVPTESEVMVKNL